MTDTIIIGGGASGMMAAISAGRKYRGSDKKILLIEQKDRLGRKVLATGNGKCNYTNSYMNSSCFYGDPSLLAVIFDGLNHENTLEFFREIGVWPKERNGYFYPNSEQASSLVWAMETEIRRLPVTIKTKCAVKSIGKKGKSFVVRTDKEEFSCRKLIVACGLKASPKLGSDGSLLPVIEKMGHHLKPVLPSLCGFYCRGADFKTMAGVRADASVKLVCDGKTLCADMGEIQFTEYGLSGIPVFQISHRASILLQKKKKCQAVLDLLPEMTEEEFYREMEVRRQKNALFSAEALLMGILPQKLIAPVVEKAGLSFQAKIKTFTDRDIHALLETIKNFKTDLVKARDFEFAQVCTGGIPAEEINPSTLESKYIPGLFFAGEVLDIDGICGGYNLQWAWSSGYLAGQQV